MPGQSGDIPSHGAAWGTWWPPCAGRHSKEGRKYDRDLSLTPPQVLGPQHPHLDMINALHANIRHRFVHPERTGQVAVLAIDDLEKVPLDQVAYNGNKVYAVDNPLLVPTSNYSNGRKLVLTSILVL